LKINHQCFTTDTNIGIGLLHIRQLGSRLAKKNYQDKFSEQCVLQISTTVKQHNHYTLAIFNI